MELSIDWSGDLYRGAALNSPESTTHLVSPVLSYQDQESPRTNQTSNISSLTFPAHQRMTMTTNFAVKLKQSIIHRFPLFQPLKSQNSFLG